MSLRISACSKENTELCHLSVVPRKMEAMAAPKGLGCFVHEGHVEGSEQASVGSLEEKVQVLS